MANTPRLHRGVSVSSGASAPHRIFRTPQVETVVSAMPQGLSSLSPEIQAKVETARKHYEKLGAVDMYEHAASVLRAAVRGKLLLPSTNGADPFSLRLAELILYHSFEDPRFLPNATLRPGFERVFSVHTSLKKLDGAGGDRSQDYVRLLRDGSIEPTDLVTALYARIADMMTVHDPATERAAALHMPGMFAMHESMAQVRTAWAEPMLKIYCPIADWGAQTVAYRDMRDNAIRYLFPEEYAKASSRLGDWMPALLRTKEIFKTLLEDMSARLGLRVLVARHYSEVSQAFPDLDERTVAVSVKPFKGIGGLLNKSLKRGIPMEMVHDWSGFTVITESERLMYDVVNFLHSGGIRDAIKAHDITDFCVLPAVDYALHPKPVTHYRSVHTDTVSRDPRMVPMEAIVRTVAMHIEADEGTAGHDIYKLSPLQNGERRSFLQRLGEITSSF